jgi:hypothetical protein
MVCIRAQIQDEPGGQRGIVYYPLFPRVPACTYRCTPDPSYSAATSLNRPRLSHACGYLKHLTVRHCHEMAQSSCEPSDINLVQVLYVSDHLVTTEAMTAT